MMVAINYKIIICGIIALTTIEVALMYFNKDNSSTTTLIVGAIALAIGVILPAPKIDNRRGILKW